jgi:putative membrane protein
VSTSLAAVAVLALCLGLPRVMLPVASAQGIAQSPGLSDSDKTFAQQADQINMTEARLGEIVEMNAENPAVKAFGRLMTDDHSRLNHGLRGLRYVGQHEGVSLTRQLDQPHREEMNRLSQLRGSAFDQAFMQAMVEGHEKAVSYFEHEGTRVHDPQLKSWAMDTLPILQQHLALAQAIHGTMMAKQYGTLGADGPQRPGCLRGLRGR